MRQPRALEAIAKLFMVNVAVVMRELVDYAPSPGACAIGDCTCIVSTLGDPGEASWAGIDRFPPARPPWSTAASSPRIKKKSFSAPSTCPIDLFGPVANRSVLKRLHGRAGCVCLLVSLQDASKLDSALQDRLRLGPPRVSSGSLLSSPFCRTHTTAY